MVRVFKSKASEPNTVELPWQKVRWLCINKVRNDEQFWFIMLVHKYIIDLMRRRLTILLNFYFRRRSSTSDKIMLTIQFQTDKTWDQTVPTEGICHVVKTNFHAKSIEGFELRLYQGFYSVKITLLCGKWVYLAETLNFF